MNKKLDLMEWFGLEGIYKYEEHKETTRDFRA
jgi:hypothetical protein